ncbi:LEAF RUST 10 DISEASE-RESISTANCE LOCUS RECEPTOR-LIKE PROTEIN KINASE-like 2.5 [Morus notabilis]|uniref:LEAF RUST 10 DISEASE-RESISTANCE LOCUS RECEPTOR-LIKE PROTEIN KINASE-like 2.5 n=1 Tax=Morus notabilis TaxID=981085 RepID=UPI000CED542A|nr:LEAF RUST 10 DISEASE-RESISTANCE LOCUS RECEPTOR-LIKE PROTEIN KINASE-like 2.5 [Morus notabilis]XP_024032524.1 LEAF RUST 10 DISEASE-RESISTANCE LOCUS RECEPTOR-LIKE PROTEIN KINASE-like 2.5 [Morus notabilis]
MELLPKSLAITIFIFLTIRFSYCEGDNSEQYYFTICSTNKQLSCGDFKNLPYPFWGESRPEFCGLRDFKIHCGDNYHHPVIQINGLDYLILNVSQSNDTDSMTLARSDLWDGPCSPKYVNTTLDHNLFRFAPTVGNLTLIYKCQKQLHQEFVSHGYSNFTCGGDGGNVETVYYANDSLVSNLGGSLRACGNVIRVSISKSTTGLVGVKEALKEGFDVEYDHRFRMACGACERSGGKCGSNVTTSRFLCFCRAGSAEDSVCPSHSGSSLMHVLRIVLGIGLFSAFVICCFKNKVLALMSTKFWANLTDKNDQGLEDFIRSYAYLNVQRYAFSDLKKMTKSFKEKLGQGGYGEVYKGKLLDGERLVAVKVLNASKGNGEDFINEVASISRTSHINIVTLLGFCLEGSKRALVFEFVSNGSLEKFIQNDNRSETTPSLEWHELLQIGIGIARGLEYLHRGCNTRILHFDIKPHNILLDEDLCPKITDFGLAKLCPRKESIISTLDGARGTIGYIAPEVCSRNFGGVSHKSDVYSYGMMILEMVGGIKSIREAETECTQKSGGYFPDYIYKHLEADSNLTPRGVETDEENEIARKMIIVGLWCIQTMPSDRPSMTKVIEMLEGSLETLHIPPKSFMSTPITSSPELQLTNSSFSSSAVSN